jgi:hypothetical protein
VCAQVFQQGRHVLLHGRQKNAVAAFEKLGEGAQIA